MGSALGPPSPSLEDSRRPAVPIPRASAAGLPLPASSFLPCTPANDCPALSSSQTDSLGAAESHCVGQDSLSRSPSRSPEPRGCAPEAQARRDHRDARTSARPRAVPEVPAGGGRGSGSWATAGSASAAAREPGRVGRGLEQLRCGPAPASGGPAPAQVSGPAPAQVSGSASARVPPPVPPGVGVRASAAVGSMSGRRRRRPAGVCLSAAARWPPAGKP